MCHICGAMSWIFVLRIVLLEWSFFEDSDCQSARSEQIFWKENGGLFWILNSREQKKRYVIKDELVESLDFLIEIYHKYSTNSNRKRTFAWLYKCRFNDQCHLVFVELGVPLRFTKNHWLLELFRPLINQNKWM